MAASPQLQNKEAEREAVSLQVELLTDAPGSLQLKQAVFTMLSHAASAYNISREKT